MRAVAIGAVLVCAVGCHTSNTADVADHTLVNNVSEVVGPGACAPVEGPYALPSGAVMDFTVADADGTDDMDVGIIDDSLGCDFQNGYAVNLDVASISSGTGGVPVGNYDFVVSCRNLFTSCYFSLTWTASY